MGILAELVYGESRIPNHPLPALRLPQAARFLCLLLFPCALAAQIPPLKPPPLQPPSGSDVCSVGKTCAELAPGMIRSALGPSPLEENVRYLTDSIGARPTGSPAARRATRWAVEAFRRAGVDEVHTEKFSIPAGRNKGRTRGNRASGPVPSENVVAEIRGRDEPDDYVLLGAHLDSSRRGAGVLDDASDAALVIDAARVIHASGSIPRRSIRFVLFTGSGEGMLGAWAYARAHRAGLDNMAAAIAFDAGDAPVAGYSLGGRNDTLVAVRESLDPLRALGGNEFTLDARIAPDSFDFLLEGVPTLTAIVDPANSSPNNPSASETPDKVNIESLKRGVAIAAVTAYALADAEERVGPRLSRAEIEPLLKETGIEQEMKLQGLWPTWESGIRGRQQ
jgi:Peptidase family M28